MPDLDDFNDASQVIYRKDHAILALANSEEGCKAGELFTAWRPRLRREQSNTIDNALPVPLRPNCVDFSCRR
jgi:hypothetical protein